MSGRSRKNPAYGLLKAERVTVLWKFIRVSVIGTSQDGNPETFYNTLQTVIELYCHVQKT